MIGQWVQILRFFFFPLTNFPREVTMCLCSRHLPIMGDFNYGRVWLKNIFF
jgi:hypothetical protein